MQRANLFPHESIAANVWQHEIRRRRIRAFAFNDKGFLRQRGEMGEGGRNPNVLSIQVNDTVKYREWFEIQKDAHTWNGSAAAMPYCTVPVTVIKIPDVDESPSSAGWEKLREPYLLRGGHFSIWFNTNTQIAAFDASTYEEWDVHLLSQSSAWSGAALRTIDLYWKR
jgi:hypothetical protein